MATQAAIAAFRSVFTNPAMETTDFASRQGWFNLLWAYYDNSSFSSLANWEPYRQAHGPLYRNIRSIYNPTRRLVNFYVSQVYPGVLSEDASALPDGVQLAIPLAADTDDKLKLAISQFWQWSNWQSGNKKMVRFGAITGACLVEIVDDRERGKISTGVRWPGLVKEIELDNIGNVKSYSLEYDVSEGDENFTYRKEVDKESFSYFKDDVPFVPEGRLEAVEDNPYGFVPAVWCKHIDEGGDWGAPCIAGSIGKIDEVNGLASHTHDLVDRRIEEPGMIATDGKVGRIGDARASTATSDEYSAVESTRVKNALMLVLKAPADAKWYSMASSLNPEQVLPILQEQLREIEHDFPELSMYTELRKMSQVTGPGAARMMGDVSGRVLEVASNYDQQSIKLMQQAVAIGGFRLKEGRDGWRNPTPQQKKFGGFDLASYQRGELDFSILARPLVPMTEADQLEMTGKRIDNAVKAEPVVDAQEQLKLMGYNEDDVIEIMKRRASVDVVLEVEQ